MLFALKFLKELSIYDVNKPYKLHGFSALSEEQQINCEFKEFVDIVIEDLRDVRDKCYIEEEGFEIIRVPTRCALSPQVFETDAYNINNTIQDYVKEIMDLVRERFNARCVVTID